MTTITTEAKNVNAAAVVLGKIASQFVLNPSRPSAEWTLDKLGEFAFKSLGKSAESLWEAGRAIIIAKEKHPKGFGKWVTQYLPQVSLSTVHRAMKVGRLDFDDVKGKRVGEIYNLFLGPKSKKTPNPPAAKATAHIKALSNLLDGSLDEILSINRELLTEFNAKLTQLLDNAAATVKG